MSYTRPKTSYVGIHTPSPTSPGRRLQPHEFGCSPLGIHTKWTANIAPRPRKRRRIASVLPDPRSWWSKVVECKERLPLLGRFARDLEKQNGAAFWALIGLNVVQAALPAAELWFARSLIETAHSVGVGHPLDVRLFAVAFLGRIATTLGSIVVDHLCTYFEECLNSRFSLTIQSSILRINLSLTDSELAGPATQRRLQLLRELGGSSVYRRMFDPLGFLSVTNSLLSVTLGGGMLYSQLNRRNGFYLGLSLAFMAIEEWDVWTGRTPKIEHYDVSNDAYLRFQALFKLGTSKSLRKEVTMLGAQSYILDEASDALGQLGSLSTIAPDAHGSSPSMRWTNLITQLSRPLSTGIFIVHCALSNEGGTKALVSFAEMSILESAVWHLRIRWSGFMRGVRELKGGMDRIEALYALEREEETKDQKNMARYETRREKGRKGMKIEFRDVELRYEGGMVKALEDISFTIQAGELVAIVGHNGSGKTSLVSLLTLSEHPTSGQILINDQDVCEYDHRDLARSMSFTFQNSPVLPMTIREYVSLGSTAHSGDTPLIERALQASTADTVVDSLADGWQSYASGMMGASLSTSDWKLARVVDRPLPTPTLEILGDESPCMEVASEVEAEDIMSASTMSSDRTMVDPIEGRKRAAKVESTPYPTIIDGEEATIHFPNHSPEACVLSGGQWQRIALARSLMNPSPDLLVWDEPTATLDPIAEVALFDEMLSRRGDSTILLTTHRLNICAKVDRVLVFESGRLVEQGSHVELMEKTLDEGKYRQLWEAQAQGFL